MTLYHGGDYNDRYTGSSNADELYGHDGNDVLNGVGGDDYMRGGKGSDRFNGGVGFDRISFYELDAIQAVFVDLRTQTVTNDGYGNKEVLSSIEGIGDGTRFADTFYGNGEANLIIAGVRDTVRGYGGDDEFQLSGAPVMLDGGAGVDRINLFTATGVYGDANRDGIAEEHQATRGVLVDLSAGRIVDGHGRAGRVRLVEHVGGSALDDNLIGDSKANELNGLAGNDRLSGGLGNDILHGLVGNDRIDGGAGVDTVVYDSGDAYSYYWGTGAVVVDLSKGVGRETELATGTATNATPSVARDSILGIENVIGSGLGDRIIGNNGANYIAPGAGNDYVDAGAGSDTLSYSSARGAVVIDLSSGTASQAGSNAPDMIFDASENGQPVQHSIEADDKHASTDQVLNFENAIGSSMNDRITGSAGNNRLEGGDGGDTLNGGGGRDTLLGGAGRDHLYGGAGGDALVGEAGADRLVFKAVSDSTGPGFDTVYGFDYTQDTVDLPDEVTGFSGLFSDSPLSRGTFNADLEAALGADRLAAGHGALVQAAGGNLEGKLFLVIDANGEAGYQANEDFVFNIVNTTLPSDVTLDFFI